MSWGERSCEQKQPCGFNPTIETCNVDCPGYRWDGFTKPDSTKKKLKSPLTMNLLGLAGGNAGIRRMGLTKC